MDISHQKRNIYCLYGHVYIRHSPVEKIGLQFLEGTKFRREEEVSLRFGEL